MSAVETTDVSPKKRKLCIEGEHQEEKPDVKTLKLTGSCNGSQSPQSPDTPQTGSSTASSSQASSSGAQTSNGGSCNGSQLPQSPYTPQTGSSTASSSQTCNGTQTSNGGSLDHSEGVLGSQPTAQNVSAYSPEETKKILHLQEGTVFPEMMKRFSLDPPPVKITYNGEEFNLTSVFDEFWTEFYKTPGYTKGHICVIPNEEILSDTELLVIAKILRRGWEDEHYFPKKIAQPFLDACLFNRDKDEDVMMTKMIVLKFLEPTHEIIQIIQDNTKSEVDPEIVDAFKKLNPDLDLKHSYLKIGTKKDKACIYAVRDHILLQTIESRRIWTDELVGLLDLEMFRFLMSTRPLENDPQDDLEDKEDSITLESYIAPHKLWHTFFYGFNEETIAYYIRMLRNVDAECYYCKKVVPAKEFLSCSKMYSSFCKDRHDCILRKIDRELNLAIERKKGIFSYGDDWKRTIMYGNKWNGWPSDLKTSDGRDFPSNRHPHIVVYSLSPIKKVLIIELSISWQHWINKTKRDKISDYKYLTNSMKDNGYEVEMNALVMGSRGVVTPHVYSFFSNILGMTHSDISRTMEDISKTIITMPYNDFIYNRAVNGMYQKMDED